MSTVTDLESGNMLRSTATANAARHTIKETARSASLLVVCFIAACTAGTFAFVAARPEPMFSAIIGAVAGAALAFSAFSLGESRRLRRRLDALLALARSEA